MNAFQQSWLELQQRLGDWCCPSLTAVASERIFCNISVSLYSVVSAGNIRNAAELHTNAYEVPWLQVLKSLKNWKIVCTKCVLRTCKLCSCTTHFFNWPKFWRFLAAFGNSSWRKIQSCSLLLLLLRLRSTSSESSSRWRLRLVLFGSSWLSSSSRRRRRRSFSSFSFKYFLYFTNSSGVSSIDMQGPVPIPASVKC